MKKLLSQIIILTVLLSFYSCEKDKNSSSEKRLYLSKVIVDGKLNIDFSYDANKKVIQSNNYDTSGKVFSKSTFEYSDDHLCLEQIQYNGSVLSTRTFRYDVKNNLTRLNFCTADSSIVTNHIIYIYNEKNQCIKEEHYYGDSLYYTILNEYTGENNMASSYYMQDSLIATVNKTFDGKLNPEKYVSSMPYLLIQHNLLSATSTGINSGFVWLQLGEGFAVTYPLCECTYEYNEFNYPKKMVYTPSAPYHNVQISEFVYIE